VSALDVASEFVQTDERRMAARNLARLFMSAETLGACEQIMARAVTYAHDRIQFGEPIGTFQAVQHLLAGAEVQVRALGSSIEMLAPRISHLSDPAASHHLTLLKALAGRTGHQVSQATLQVFGGIGFTQEHEHHLYAKRLLTLDALCGSKDQLTRELGQAARLGESPLVSVP
jgi:alkylation response protein AidB-like acyl-CoA dehydrogenase